MQNKFFDSKLNRALLLTLIVLMVIALVWVYKDKEKYLPNNQTPAETLQFGEDENLVVKDANTYASHGFTLELPKGFTPYEEQAEGGPVVMISLPYENSFIGYVTNADFWEKYTLLDYKYEKDVVIGNSAFKMYREAAGTNKIYWLRKGKIGYLLSGDLSYFTTFKFIGWPQQVENDKKTFVGTITALDNGCWVDGICKIQVDSKIWITYNIGRNLKQLPIGVIDGEFKIGAKVEVYGEKDADNTGEYTIIGDTKYYIKVVKEFENQNNTVLQSIYTQYKNGMIAECKDGGKVYYSANLNAYDGGGVTFDSSGKVVGQYQGFTGKYTGIEPKNCTNIYVVDPNIWGYPSVNSYNLK